VRSFFADNALGGADAGAVHQDAGGSVVGCGLGDGGFGAGAVGDVAMDGDAVDVDRHFGCRFIVDIEDGDFGAGGGEHARGGGAEAGASAGDERCVSANVHDQLAFAVGVVNWPATVTFGGGADYGVEHPRDTTGKCRQVGSQIPWPPSCLTLLARTPTTRKR